MSAKAQAVLARYEKGVEVFEQALRNVPAAILDRSPAPGKWSVHQLAIHLADAELVGAARFRMMAAQPGSTLHAYDQDAWANNLAYPKQSVEQALELFRAIRRSTAAMLRALPASAWDNKAVHEETGEVTLEGFVEHYAEHAEHHARQIRELRQKFQAAAGAA